jgi:multiple sugar transport system substrate-binding protein
MRGDRIAGLVTASWRQSSLMEYHPQTAGKWRVIRTPEHDFVQGGLFLAIPAQTKNPEAAWEFVKYVCGSADGQNAFFKTTGIFPAYKPAWQDPLYDQPVPFFGGQPVYRLWAAIAENMPAGVVSTHEQAAGEAVFAEISKVQSKIKDPVQAMQDAEARVLKEVAGLVG